MNSQNPLAKLGAGIVLVALAATTATAKPTVIIANPMNGTAVSGKDVSVVISYSSPDSTIVALDLLIDGQSVFTKKLSTPQQAGSERFSFDTTLLTDAVHTLGAIAHDARGDTGNASVKIYVSNKTKDTFPPTVVITKPSPGATVSGTVEVAMEAHDNKLLQFVTLFIDDTFKFFGNAAPFRYLWDTRKTENGAHTLLAKAYDGERNEGVSPPVVVTVNNEGGKTTMKSSPFRDAGQPPAPFKSAGTAPAGAKPIVKQPSSAQPAPATNQTPGKAVPAKPATAPKLPVVHLTKPAASTPGTPAAPGVTNPAPATPGATAPGAPRAQAVLAPVPTAGQPGTTVPAAPKPAAPFASTGTGSPGSSRSQPAVAVSTHEAPTTGVAATVARARGTGPATHVAPAPGVRGTGRAPVTGGVAPTRTQPESAMRPVITRPAAKISAPAVSSSGPQTVESPPVSSSVRSSLSVPGLTAVQVPPSPTAVAMPQPEAPAFSAPRRVRIAKLPPTHRGPASVAVSSKPTVSSGKLRIKPTTAIPEPPLSTRIAILPPTSQATPPDMLAHFTRDREANSGPARAKSSTPPPVPGPASAVPSGLPTQSTVRRVHETVVASLPHLALVPTVASATKTPPKPTPPVAVVLGTPAKASRASVAHKPEPTRFPDQLVAVAVPAGGTVRPDLPLVRGKDLTVLRSGPTTVRKTYTVRPGDNLTRIARRFNVSVVDIALSNNIENPRTLRPGHQLVIPNRSLQVFYDNHAIKLDVAPFAKAGVPLAPFRPIFEHAGGTVVWVHQTKTVKARKDDHTVQLKIGSRTALIDGQSVLMELAALIKDSRTMVPTSLFAKTLDVEVRFDPETGSIMIASK